MPREVPDYLYDRGTGTPVSIFSTYIEKGELLIYPFYEYYYDNDLEYEPYDFGLRSKQEYHGRYEAHEGLIFIGYGITDKLAIELVAGIISAKFNKSEKDTSALAKEIKESGLSDIEGQIRWRWNRENLNTP